MHAPQFNHSLICNMLPLYRNVLQLLSTLPSDRKERPGLVRGPLMYKATFASLSLRLHQPYWLLHAGNCEHHFVFEQIR